MAGPGKPGRRSRLDRIKQEYQKNHGIQQPNGGTGYTSSIGNSVEIAGEYDEDTERQFSEPVGGYEGFDEGVSGGQRIDRNLHRGDGRDDEQNEYPDRSNDQDRKNTSTGSRASKKFIETLLTPQKKKPEKPVKTLAQPMSNTEVKGMRERFQQAFVGAFKAMDELIQLTTPGHPPVEIWSAIDDTEINIMVSALLMRAQMNARVAEGIRQAVALYEQFAIGAIMLPAFVQTWIHYDHYGFELPSNSKARQRRQKQKQELEAHAALNRAEPVRTAYQNGVRP